jgi:hypothetical protein
MVIWLKFYIFLHPTDENVTVSRIDKQTNKPAFMRHEITIVVKLKR